MVFCIRLLIVLWCSAKTRKINLMVHYVLCLLRSEAEMCYIPRKFKRLKDLCPLAVLKRDMFSFCELRVLRLLGTKNFSCKIVKNRILSEVCKLTVKQHRLIVNCLAQI